MFGNEDPSMDIAPQRVYAQRKKPHLISSYFINKGWNTLCSLLYNLAKKQTFQCTVLYKHFILFVRC